MIFKFNEFINEEVLGVSLPSVSYAKLVFDKVYTNFLTFLSDSEKRKLEKIITISKFEINTKVKDQNRKYLSQHPISKFEINLHFKKARKTDSVSEHRHFIKNGYLVGAAARNIGEESDDTRIINNEIIFNMDINIDIDPSRFKEVSEDFKNQIESSIWHELNHNYELWSKYKNDRQTKALPVSITWSDKNSWGIPKEVFKQWNREFLFFIYISEPHEIRAIIQELGFFINKEKKINKNNLAYEHIIKMRSFVPEKFIEHMKEVIKENIGDVDYQYILERLKNMWISNYKQQLRNNKESDKININKIEKMTAEEFINFFGKKIQRNGEYLFRKVHKMVGNI